MAASTHIAAPMPALAEQARVVTYWRQEAARNEALRNRLLWTPVIGTPLAVAVDHFHTPAALLFLFIVMQTLFVGMYMTWVRRHEFADELYDAERALAEAQRPRGRL